jgi:hypothetical protein
MSIFTIYTKTLSPVQSPSLTPMQSPVLGPMPMPNLNKADDDDDDVAALCKNADNDNDNKDKDNDKEKEKEKGAALGGGSGMAFMGSMLLCGDCCNQRYANKPKSAANAIPAEVMNRPDFALDQYATNYTYNASTPRLASDFDTVSVFLHK